MLTRTDLLDAQDQHIAAVEAALKVEQLVNAGKLDAEAKARARERVKRTEQRLLAVRQEIGHQNVADAARILGGTVKR